MSEISELRTEFMIALSRVKKELIDLMVSGRKASTEYYQEKFEQTFLDSMESGQFGFGRTLATTPLPVGLVGTVRIPYNGTITEWGIVSEEEGILLLDIYKATFETYPPTIYDSITGSQRPYLENESKRESSDISQWNTSVAEGDFLAIYSLKDTEIVNVLFYVKIQKS